MNQQENFLNSFSEKDKCHLMLSSSGGISGDSKGTEHDELFINDEAYSKSNRLQELAILWSSLFLFKVNRMDNIV